MSNKSNQTDNAKSASETAAKAASEQTSLQGGAAQEVTTARATPSTAPKATNPSGRGATNNGEVADQAAADKAAEDAKAEELSANAGGTLRANAEPEALAVGANNPADGTPIKQSTNDVTRPDATKGPLHNPGVVVDASMDDPSPTTAVAPGSVLSATASTKRDMTDPSRKHD